VRAGARPAVFFDLDGTLADTAPDLAAALNALRAEHALPPLPLASVRPCVSGGSPALLGLAFGRSDPGDLDYRALRGRFLDLYGERVARETFFFPGIAEVLDALGGSGVPFGVVTNKPARLTHPLLDALGIASRVACVVCGDTLAYRKPHPAPLLHAARLLGREPGGCVFVGDSRDDIAAGRAAGMTTLLALFGYLAPGEDPAAFGAHGTVSEPGQVLAWVPGFAERSGPT
jgi:phosphoglycolate phosphatase